MISKSYFDFEKWHVFAHFCIILPIAARADFKLWRARTALWKVKSDCKWMEIVNYGKRNPNHAEILNFDFFRALCARTTRARTRTDGKTWNALNDLVRTLLCWWSDFEHFKILTRAHVRVVTRTGTKIVIMLDNDLKFMCTEFGQFMRHGYEDMNDNVKTQNGAWMTSWLSDQTEKRRFSIPDNAKDTVKIR